MIVVLRHGERADQTSNKEELKAIETYFDPHLTKVGAQQA
jgi:broad specificity phosphatase PhoE